MDIIDKEITIDKIFEEEEEKGNKNTIVLNEKNQVVNEEGKKKQEEINRKMMEYTSKSIMIMYISIMLISVVFNPTLVFPDHLYVAALMVFCYFIFKGLDKWWDHHFNKNNKPCNVIS